jgi:hypothetical protein
MEDNSARLNGYKPRSYGDIVAVATLLAMLMSVVVWGIKLEGELNEVRNDLIRVQAQVGQGILPRAEERIRHLENDLEDHLENALEDHLERDHQ